MNRSVLILAAATAVLCPAAATAQQHIHTPGMRHPGETSNPGPPVVGGVPAQSGQDAYAAIAEIVALLERDPGTDWAAVNLERLRQHLIDMNEVTLRARVAETPVAGGVRMDVTGEGRTIGAIRRMVGAHGSQLGSTADYLAKAEEISGGARLTVTAKRSGDRRMEAKIRALGFIGLLTTGDHHGRHHLAMARGGLSDHAH